MMCDVVLCIGGYKLVLIEFRFFSALKGESGKMSVLDVMSVIYVMDMLKEIKIKVNKYVFSGG